MVVVDRPEPPRPVRIQVELRFPGRHQLRDRSPDPAGATESVQRKPGRHVESAHSRDRSDKRCRIRGHRVGMADELDDACVMHKWKTARRAGEQGLEARLVGRQGDARVFPWHAVDPPGDRV